MKFGVPWSVKGIRPEARETAKEAARRSGMPLGEWLNSVILQQADEDGIRPSSDDDDSYGDDLSSVHHRLDDITRRIEKFTHAGPSAYAPKQVRQDQGRNDNDQIAQLIARLDRRLEQMTRTPQMMAPTLAPAMPGQMLPGHAMPPQGIPRPAMPAMGAPPAGLDRAVAEIAARQRALNGQAAPGQPSVSPAAPAVATPVAPPQAAMPPPPPVLMPVPSQDLSGLEEHLRQITDQIETLRRPGVEDAINALRDELGDIGRALNEAMPRKAIDAIERQIQGLTQRIAEGRQAGLGADADGGALSGIEHGLAEVRDVLRGLTPAENLVGFNEAVDGLARKIDLIVAQKDPETLGQLEHAITTLREMAGHVASGDAVSRLAAQVQELGEKVEHFGAAAGSSDALNHLEQRIGALSDALTARTQNGGAVPPRLEALVESLSDKIEKIQQSRGDNIAAGHLEDQIVALVQRLDASDSRLGHLEAIERGLADLLVHIEEIRANKSVGGLREETSPGVIELKQEMTRTQDALNAVHGTLGQVVDRLAMMEKGYQGEARGHGPADPEITELTRPVGKVAARMVVEAPVQPPEPRPAPQAVAPSPPPAPPQAAKPVPQPQQKPQPAPAPAAPKRMPQAARLPINPNLPPDQPLEPGSGPPAMRASASRIAASEAALGGMHPQAAAAPAGKTGFIAAARRAAQTAIETATPAKPPQPETFEPDAPGDNSPLRKSMFKRVKSLFIAASLIAIVIGSIQIASNVMNFGGPRDIDTARAPAPSGDAGQSSDDQTGKIATAAPASPAIVGASPLSPATPPGYLTPSPSENLTASQMPQGLYPPRQPSPSLLNPPAINPPPPDSANDITGSIPSAAKSRMPRPAPAPAPPDTDQLPIAIGSERLRIAAISGDGTAAYEVAQRFAEGRGVLADPAEAARWYERAASKGLAPAEFRYASLLEKGQGVKKNLGQARRLYLAAASKGHAKAMHNLAVLYAEGIDGKPDYGTAVQWFSKAAKHGIADSQYNLGVLCARGLGTEKDVAASYKWFALAANQGDREAAKKRDEVASHLEPDALADAQEAVKTFEPEAQPHTATTVAVPKGGWDGATSPPPVPQSKPRARAAASNMSARSASGR